MGLLKFLKENENVRKLFGKRELKIIEKQLLGINLTQSEKNRLSRDIRKKLDVIKEASKFEKEFELKKGAEIKKKINEAKEIILADVLHSHIKTIKLFGSAVENKLTFRSDIDLAIIFDEISLKEATNFRKRILGRTSEKIDVQVYNILDKKIKKEVDEKGRSIYESRKN
ncbi:MAG: nucleotidyltransferase domain-containing protein [Nanoarchaeota archaeon]|nr:nucleotidyltransferase domain-containing protein [Nanoarchaeota archaeon]